MHWCCRIVALGCMCAALPAVAQAPPSPSGKPPEKSVSGSASGSPGNAAPTDGVAVQSLPDISEQAFVPAAKHGIPLAFTLRGGVSLGAFEAGYLYYLAEALKRNPDLFDPRIVTGASAGSINALLLLMALGEPVGNNPQAHPFYTVWTALNQNALLDTANPNTPMGAFSSGEELLAAAEKVWAAWREGLDESFEMIVGMSTTRLNPHEVEIAKGFKLPRQAERFVFLIKGRGAGRPPEILNYVHVKNGLLQAMLPFEDAAPDDAPEVVAGKERANFEMLRDVLMASAAFPIGFPPRRLDYCLVPVTDETDGHECVKATHSDLFVDGGVFDNNPLRLAHRIAAMGLVRDGNGRLERRGTAHAQSYLYNYLDPDHNAFPTADGGAERQEMPFAPDFPKSDRDVDVLKLLPGFLGTFVKSARAAELYALVEEFPEVRKHMRLTTTEFPIVSNELGAFFGFFDREFLKYDFYLGMYSAYRYVLQTVDRYVDECEDTEIVAGFENATLPEMENTEHPAWAPFFCMRSWFDSETKYRGACADLSDPEAAGRGGAPDMDAFRILMQLSLDRLYDHCSQLKDAETEHHHCLAAMAVDGRPPSIVAPTTPQPDGYWRQCRVCRVAEGRCRKRHEAEQGCVCKCGDERKDEAGFNYTMRLLGTYGFRFRDLGLTKAQSAQGLSAVRQRFLSLLTAFSGRQEDSRRRTFLLLGKPALNFLYYDPPEQILYLSVWSGTELGWSRAFRKARALRLSLVPIQMRGLLEVFTTKTMAFIPAVGLEVEVLPVSSPLFQFRLGARVGYQLSTRGGFTTATCAEDAGTASTIYCSFPVAQFLAIGSFYERVRLHVGVEWTPPWIPGIPPENNHWVTIIAGLGWQWLSPF